MRHDWSDVAFGWDEPILHKSATRGLIISDARETELIGRRVALSQRDADGESRWPRCGEGCPQFDDEVCCRIAGHFGLHWRGTARQIVHVVEGDPL